MYAIQVTPEARESRTAHEMLKKNPISLVEEAVKGMLPKNRLGKGNIQEHARLCRSVASP